MVAERRLLAWDLWSTAIVILRLLLLLHVICLRRWLLHVLCAWLWLLGTAKGRRRVLLDAWWGLLLGEAAISVGSGLRLETLRRRVLCEVAQPLDQVVLLELTRHLEVIDAIIIRRSISYFWKSLVK